MKHIAEAHAASNDDFSNRKFTYGTRNAKMTAAGSREGHQPRKSEQMYVGCSPKGKVGTVAADERENKIENPSKGPAR